MVRAEPDERIKPIVIDGFTFPRGVYPIEAMTPRAGYNMLFEQADGVDPDSGGPIEGPIDGDDLAPSGPGDLGDEWEAWPDRYVFDAVVPADRIQSLLRSLIQLMPSRIYPILDVMGHDAFREIDPYISYELIGQDKFIDALRRFGPFFFEDGLVGFGAMSDDPFFYVFVDEHKIVTIRATPDMKERIEAVLAAYDLEQMDEPAGADAAAHEHRTVLITPDDDADLLGVDEIVERLRDDWRLTLNVDRENNLDDGQRELGMTGWRCLVRVRFAGSTDPDPRKALFRYLEVLLQAASLREAEEVAFEAVLGTVAAAPPNLPAAPAAAEQADPPDSFDDAVVIASDRLSPEQWKDSLAKAAKGQQTSGSPRPAEPLPAGVESLRWLN